MSGIHMISVDSPLRQIPQSLDIKDAFFVDGLRHAAEICDLAFKRLTANLLQITLHRQEDRRINAFPSVFLDAWAFVDSVERYRCLNLMRSRVLLKTKRGPAPQQSMNEELLDLSKVRNVSAHIAERSDHVISKKGAALGTLSWITVTSKRPLKAMTCIIRPGYISGDIRSQFSTCSGNQVFVNDCTNVMIHAGENDADLSKSYLAIARSVHAIESELRSISAEQNCKASYPADLFASAELDFSDHAQLNQSSLIEHLESFQC